MYIFARGDGGQGVWGGTHEGSMRPRVIEATRMKIHAEIENDPSDSRSILLVPPFPSRSTEND